MTALLQQAFRVAQELPEPEQDRVAQWLLAEIRSEVEWDQSFSRTLTVMEGLAEVALSEHRSGATVPLDPASL